MADGLTVVRGIEKCRSPELPEYPQRLNVVVLGRNEGGSGTIAVALPEVGSELDWFNEKTPETINPVSENASQRSTMPWGTG